MNFKIKYALTILIFNISLLTFAQITYTKIPLDLQLVARDKTTNLGNVIIEGNVDLTSGYSSINVEIYRNDVLLDSENVSLVYNASIAPFSFNLSILSELANYSFKIYGYKSSEAIYELNKTVSNVVAGDVYIIQGQSNAVAAKMSGSANGSKSDYIRVYSSGTPSSAILLSNNAWYIADGDVSSGSNGNTGQWGLKLAKILVDDLQIPIAIFNGAYGGQPITFFQAPADYKTSLSSNYGRLFYRLNQTGLRNSVKAVLWSQGESNAKSSYISIFSYKNYFKALENSWLNDYPNIENIYIFQTKDCNCSTTFDGKMNVKEAQRQLANENDEIEIMPTTSLLLSADNCHFPFVNGYESFATRIHKLVLHDIYGKSYTEEIKAPMIKSAEFVAPNTLIIETDAISLKFSSTDQTTMLTRLKQDFELRNAQGALITDVVLSGNKIYFTLSSDPGPIGNVSFVGYNSNIGFTITNSSNIELISFRNYPIKNLTYDGGNISGNPTIENTFICNASGSSASIAVNSSTTNTIYTWLVKTPDGEWTAISSLNASTVYSTYNTAILNIKKSSTLPVTGTLYRVVVNGGVSGDLTSNEAALIVDAAPVSKLIIGASTVCSGESKTLNYGIGSVGTIQWQYSTTSSTSDFIDLYEENGLTYTASDLQQTTWFRVANESGACPSVYSAAVQVTVNPKPVSGYIEGGNLIVCKTSNSTLLTLLNSVGKIQWQKASDVAGIPGAFANITSATSATYTAASLTATTYFRAVLSSGVCISEISNPVVINVNPSALAKSITGASPVCIGGSKMLTYGTSSVGTIQWQYSTTSGTTDFVNSNGENGLTYMASNIQQTTWFRVMNTSGVCSPVYSVAVQVVVNQLPVAGYISGGDTNVCISSNSTLLSLNNSIGTIQWQKAYTLTGTYASITSATSTTYTSSALTATTYFRAIVSSGVCTSEITNPVVINVNPLSLAKTIIGASPVCIGGSKMLTYGTSSVGTIQWQYSTTSGTADFIDINGENGLTYTASNIQQTTWFRVMNTSGICSPVYSAVVQVVVNQLPVAGFILGGDVNVCMTSNSTLLSLNNSIGTIQWQKASTLMGTYASITSATSATYTSSALIATTYFRAIVSSGVCTSELTNPVVINVNPLSLAKTIIGASPVCIGGSKTLTYGIGSVGTIQWQYSNTSSTAGFIDIAGENGLNYTATNIQQTTWFRVMNTSGLCLPAYSLAVQVVVNPSATPTFNQVAAICTGASLLALPTTSTNAIMGLWSPALNNTLTTIYTFTPTSGGCINIAKMAITVNQKETPTFDPVAPICSGESLSELPTISTNGITGTWLPSLSNTVTKMYTFTPTNAVCTSTATLTINVNTTLPPLGDAIQFFNTNNPILIKDLVVVGTDLLWYSTYENALTNTNSLELTAVVTLGNTYYAKQFLNGCFSISPLAVIVTTSLETTGFNFEGLCFYPNPITNYFKLIYSEIITDVELFNILGKSVFIAHPNALETTLNINHLSAGIYFMELRSKDKKGVVKVIKS